MGQFVGLVQPPWDGDNAQLGDESSSAAQVCPRDSNSESDSSVLKRRSLCAVGGDWEDASSSIVGPGLKWLAGTRDGLPGSSIKVGGGSC